MTLAARSPLVVFGLGALSIAYGSIATLPGTTAGQIVVTVFLGAALVLWGAVRLALLLAMRPGEADSMLEALLDRSALKHLAPSLVARTAFAEVPLLRWGLCAAMCVVAVFAVAVLASDVFAWTRLGWAVPDGAARVVLG